MKIFTIILCACMLAVPMGSVVHAAPQKISTTKDYYGDLWFSVEHNDPDHVRKVLRKDKRLVYSVKKGLTPYLYSVQKGYRKMAWMLVDEFWAHAYDRCAWGNALHVAIENQDFPMLKLTMKAAQMDFDEGLLDRLINEQRYNRKPDQKRADLNTPLHVAAQYCNRPIYDYLVSFGASEKTINADWKTAAEILATCPPEKPKNKK